MNDFFIASGRSVAVTLGDSQIQVQQFKMHNLDEWFPPALAVKTFLEKKDYSDEILTHLFLKHGAQTLQLCALATGIKIDVLIERARKDELGFKVLLRTLLDVNEAYFKEPKPRQKVKPGEEQSSWFNAFQFLVSSGHRHDEVMKMTYGAFITYLKAAKKIYLDDHKLSANVIRAAQHADERGFKKFQAELGRD